MTAALGEREHLLRAIAELTSRIWDPARSLSAETRRVWLRDRDELLDRYYRILPLVPFGRCPHCQAPAMQAMDVSGIDGLWWHRFSRGTTPSTCDHFLTLLGALNFQGHEPTEASADPQDVILSGPEVPFVVPRFLELPEVRCVLASSAVSGGRYRAYFISYYADPPLPATAGHQPWLRDSFVWRDDEGHELWDTADDRPDFNIRRWMTEVPGRILWIAPDDSSATLWHGVADCPYLSVAGRRASLEVQQGRIIGPPSGQPSGARDGGRT